MQTISLFFAHAAFTLMAICAILLLPRYFFIPSYRKNQSILLFSILLLCGCGYLITEAFGAITNMSFIWWLEYIASNALPGMFWLTSISIFAERHVLKRWQYYIASLTLIIPLTSTLLQVIFSFDLRELPAMWGLKTYGAMSLELVLLGHALVVAVQHWQADLVQARRYMRGSVIGIIAVYIVMLIVIEQLFSWQWIWLDTIKFVLLTLLAGSVNFVLFSIQEGTLFDAPERIVENPAQVKARSPEVQRIVDSMTNDKLYQKEGMTINTLSRHLAIHEYKLRQLINGELAYRNFNDFLNFYRIQEVTEKLSDPDSQHLPVLTLALESGFRSLSSFNKAFKNNHGMTPTEYRNRQ